MSYSNHTRASRLINHSVIVIILILGILAVVHLLQPSDKTITHILTTPRSNITVMTPSNAQVAISREVKVKLTYSGSNYLPAFFRLANSQDDLTFARSQQFISSNQEVPWRLAAGNGQRAVFAQFKLGDNWLPALSTTVTLNVNPVQGFQVGVSIPNIINYPYNDILSYSHAADIATDLKILNDMRGSVVRVYVPYNKISDTVSSKRLSDFLVQAAGYRIKVIPVLIDDYATSHNPQDTDQYYAINSAGTASLDHEFFESGYKNEYLSFVRRVVSDNQDNPNIYAWEIGNELKDPDSTQTFLNFMQEVSSTIKGLDPMHDIIAGISSTQQLGLTPLQFYTTLPDIDIVSIHSYDGDHIGEPDAVWAKQNFREALVEVESLTGTRSDDRSTKLSQEISYWKKLGVSGLLMPNFIAKGVKDNGDGSKTDGMDAIFHGDYDSLSSVLKTSVK